MNVLFICSRNRWRSLTAEKLFRGRPGLDVKSAGTAENARIKVSSALIRWAGIIFVMEQKHQDILTERYPKEVSTKRIINLDIPDTYFYGDEELKELLEQATQYFPTAHRADHHSRL